MRKWQFQEAKAKLSEVSRCAHAEGPQVITRFGKDDLVVLTKDEYDRLAPAPTPAPAAESLLDFFRRNGLLGGVELTDDDLDPNGPVRRIEDLFARDQSEYGRERETHFGEDPGDDEGQRA